MNNNILVVDDEESIRSCLNRLLLKHGYDVLLSSNGYETIEMVNKQKVDVVLLDLVLPGMNGLEILKSIKKENPYIEVIMMSGKGTFSDVVDIIKEGAYDYVGKPFKNEIILSKIIMAIKNRELNLKCKYLDKRYNNIKQLKKYNENIIKSLPMGLLTVNNDDYINIFNSSIGKTLKLKSEDVIEKNIYKFFYEIFTDYDKIEHLYKNLKKNNEEFNDLFLNNELEDDKKKYHFRVLGTKFSEGILLFIKDITDEYNIKQQLIQNEKISAIGQFVASITHGLGNNMANVIANASGISDEIDILEEYIKQIADISCLDIKNKDTKQNIENINKKIIMNKSRIVDYSTRLINRIYEMDDNIKSLLHFSRQQTLIRIPSDINNVVEEAVNIVKSRGYNNIKFTGNLITGLPKINVNPYQIRDVVIDLVLNGIHAMDEKGVIKYETKLNKEKKVIQICITDQGNGILDEIKEKVFSAFFTTKSHGTGLGLSNVKNIISQHNGEITFKTKQDNGTTFFVDIPV